MIADSFGRAWRLGQAEVAIGCAGLTPLDDWRGRTDADGRELEATLIAIADEAAAAADLVRGKDSRVPAVIVRGLDRFVTADDGPGAAALRRPRGRGPLPLTQAHPGRGGTSCTFSSTASGDSPSPLHRKS